MHVHLSKFLFLFFGFTFCITATHAQAINISGISATNRFNTCASTYGAPVISANFVSGTGSTVSNGAIVCLNASAFTVIHISISNIRWNQSPGTAWLHGLSFPSGSGITIANTILPPGFIFQTSCTGANCSAHVTGGPGFYYDGTIAASCCTATLNDGNAANNWGVSTFKCEVPMDLSFDMTIQNSALSGGPALFTLRGTTDGATGCWAIPDPTLSLMNFQFSTVSCSPPSVPDFCNPAGNATYAAGAAGSVYQWQKSTDSITFTNIQDNAEYSGTMTANLHLTNIPSNRYGEQYRCIVDGISGTLHTLKFKSIWTGAINRNWNVPGNWSCNTVPDAFTDAVINSGTINVSANCSVRSVSTASGVAFSVDPGILFTVVH